MHADEVEIDAGLVRRLLVAQLPHWSALPVERVRFFGTDNAMYRLGSDLAVRLPRRAQNLLQLENECLWLPELAPLLPVPVPVPVAVGEPGEGYPLRWAVYRWIEGEPADAEAVTDVAAFARDLAEFVAALHRVDPSGGPTAGRHNVFRGEPVARRDRRTREAFASLRGELDVDAATAVWEDALHAPMWAGAPVWIHGDLDARNLLVIDGRLSGVIDFGTLGVGDPAWDVTAAWKVLDVEARGLFRSALAVDDAAWVRSRGLVLSQAVIALAYYTLENNPVLVREARRWLTEVLAA
jgi:aminoglycoside phosphotransferase (APT) family kinase protein